MEPASRCKLARVREGLTIEQLAHTMERSASLVSSVERRRMAAGADLRRRFAEALRVPEDYLFEERQARQSKPSAS